MTGLVSLDGLKASGMPRANETVTMPAAEKPIVRVNALTDTNDILPNAQSESNYVFCCKYRSYFM